VLELSGIANENLYVKTYLCTLAGIKIHNPGPEKARDCWVSSSNPAIMGFVKLTIFRIK